MKWRPAALWPKSLGGRLVILLVAALAVAQVSLVLVLRGQQRSMVDGIIHGQTLIQTVTLSRLLTEFPASQGADLAAAFASRESCALITDSAPTVRQMNSTEQDLASILGAMLHGVKAGSPTVTVDRIGHGAHPCGGTLRDKPGQAGGSPGDERHGRVVAVATGVPLDDGRFVSIRTSVQVPGDWDGTFLLSFLLSSLAVTIVAIVAVRTQTRALRTLADASDRFGRGEAVEPLPETGPSEIVATTRAFNVMQDRLSLFLRDRLRLLGSISHDLRTPLTTLRLKAELIDDETTRDDLVATIDELTVICEATLAFTRAEAATEATVALALDHLVDELVAEFQLGGADVEVVASEAVSFACRPVALKRALRNLVDNAVRYGGGTRLSLSRTRDDVVLTVDDDGPGLPADRIEEAFEPFVRLEPSRSVETGGIGLGLAIARSIVKAHAGTLTLTNRPGGGLRAEIRLPLHGAEQLQPG